MKCTKLWEACYRTKIPPPNPLQKGEHPANKATTQCAVSSDFCNTESFICMCQTCCKIKPNCYARILLKPVC